MDEYIKNLFNDVMNELSLKIKQYPDDKTYSFILKQIEFVQNCLENDKDLSTELNGRELNFSVVASKNLSGPETELQQKISEIAVYLSKI